MSDFLTKFGKAGALFLLMAALVVTSFGQVKLRDAMDYDDDDKADFTVFRPSNNVWYVNKSNGGFIFQQFGLSNTDFPAPGDFDGDGIGDISVWRDSDGIWYRLNSSNSTFVAQPWGISGDEPVARDFDGDGKTDHAVVRRTGGGMIWYILGSTGGFMARPYGLSTDFTAPGDYDGDGKFDLAVQRAGATPTSQATFYISLSGSAFSTISYNWGFGTDLVVPGDYDGDGKTDVAVVREGSTPTSTLNWFILKSTDLGLLAYNFGITGDDLNAQNDYTGDGKTNVAVWRNSTGTFYYLRTNGTTANTTWGAPNDFPVASYDTH